MLSVTSGICSTQVLLLWMIMSSQRHADARRRHHRRHHVTCQDKSTKELKTEWQECVSQLMMHSSYTMLPFLQQTIQSALRKSTHRHQAPITAKDTNASQSCRVLFGDLQLDGSTIQRSLCPAYYVRNHDPDRYPQELIEAECQCTERCVGLLLDSGTGCEKIYYNVPVLRRTAGCDVNNKYIYEQGW